MTRSCPVARKDILLTPASGFHAKKLYRNSPVRVFHRRRLPNEPVTSLCPSGLNNIFLTVPVCPVSVWRCSWVLISQSWMVVSSWANASVCPLGLNATLVALVCSVNKSSSSPVWASYIQTPMELATARRLPSGEYAISRVR